MLLLGVPAIFIFSPLIQFFPVGLGLDMLVASCAFYRAFVRFAVQPHRFLPLQEIVFRGLSHLSGGVFLLAHISIVAIPKNNKKPNSLIYYQDADAQKSYWVTYDKNFG